MKLFFLKDHSLYKIFKTLEKVPAGKTIYISIDPEHAFFDNERWGKQIKELLEKKKLDAYFVTKTEKTRRFFAKLGLQVQHQEKHPLLRIFNVLYLLLFNIKKFHLHAYNKKNYIFYIIFGFEVAFVMLIFYALYVLILPSATITITPASQFENITYNFRYYPHSDTQYPRYSRYLSIPFQTGYIDYKYEMSVSVSNIKHIQEPSAGTIKIYNFTPQELSLVPNTRFITDDGRLFKALNRFTIPAGHDDIPGETNINVVAMETDEEGVLMGTRGNIPKDTKLYIRNLNQSYYLKEIYAESIESFTGGSLESEGTVTQADIDTLSGKLIEYITNQKKNIVTQNFSVDNAFLLPFHEFIIPSIQEIVINTQPGEDTSLVQGHIIARIQFYYVHRDKLLAAIKDHVAQRPSEKVELITIDKGSLNLYDEVEYIEDVLVIPTQISVVQGYDFTNDINGVISDLKSRIVSANKQEAREVVLGYPEVSTARIKVTPPRYHSIPKLKSRIKIRYETPGTAKE